MKDNIMREKELFDIVRNEPTEITLEKVDKMVSAFPLVPAPFDWSSIINLNSIIMTSVTAFILAGSFMLYSGDSNQETLETKSYQIIPDTEMVQNNFVPQEEAKENSESSPIEEPNEPTPPTEVEAEAAAPIAPSAEPEGPLGPEGEEQFAEVVEPPVVEEIEEPEEIMADEIEMELEEMRVPPIYVKQMPDPVVEPTPHTMEQGRKTFDVGSFSSIGLSGSIDMHVTQGSDHSVWAEGDESDLEKIEVVEKNGHIKVKMKKKSGNSKNCYSKADVTVHVTMPSFESLHVSGSGSMEVGDFDNLDDVEMHIAGSGSIKAERNLKINGSSEFHIAGSGYMNIDGTAQQVDVHIAGSGDFKGADLRAQRVEVHIAGSGDVQVHAEEELDISIAGSGDVSYEGNPKITKSIAGSGDINRMN